MTPFAICMLVAVVVFFIEATKVQSAINLTALGFGFCALAVLFLTNSFKG